MSEKFDIEALKKIKVAAVDAVAVDAKGTLTLVKGDFVTAEHASDLTSQAREGDGASSVNLRRIFRDAGENWVRDASKKTTRMVRAMSWSALVTEIDKRQQKEREAQEREAKSVHVGKILGDDPAEAKEELSRLSTDQAARLLASLQKIVSTATTTTPDAK